MSGIIDIATAILSNAERRLEIVSNNISNSATPGFKTQSSFQDMLSTSETGSKISSTVDFSAGKLSSTNSPLDIAITGSGFFQYRMGNDVYYSRQGQLSTDIEGRMVSPQGLFLQSTSGNDIVLSQQEIELTANGAILENGLPIASIGVFDLTSDTLKPTNGSFFTTTQSNIDIVERPHLQQGMLETANVELADEMLIMMEAVRMSETGSRLVQLYDTLLGQSISTFGQGAR